MPEISYKPGHIWISGRSIILEPGILYNNLLDNFHRYIANPLDQTEIHISLDYMNSASNRHLMNFLILAEKLYSQGKKVDVFWYFDPSDEMSREQGTIFKDLLELPFHLIEQADFNKPNTN
ncbi:MAG: SiaC family regulatory phosphoprotein [Bacteroidales bacterium]